MQRTIDTRPGHGVGAFHAPYNYFAPARGLDGRHTVFGRVAKGLDVLAKIQRRDPSKQDQPVPDRILEAKVLSKRDHPYYEPKKIEG